MSSKNVLLLVLDSVPDERIRAAVRQRRAADVTVHVVAPASGTGVLKWLAGDEDEARAEAEDLAVRTAEAIEADVETEVGDRDPVLAVQDALSMFPADEIVVAGDASPETENALRRLGVPVSRLNGQPEPTDEESGAEAVAHEMARGQRDETPFLLLGAVGAVALGAIVIISLIAFLVFWLA